VALVATSVASVRSARQPSYIGSEVPRVFTPPLRKLTPRTSRGFECIEFAETVLEIELLPWQKWLLIHALELLPDGTYRFRTVLLLVARQNGKSTLMMILSLWRMFVDGAPLVIGTAQNLDVAEEIWQAAVDLAQDVPELAAEIAQVLKVNGKKQLRLVSGERYKVAAASRRGGRGLSGDLVLLDELREHQTWAAWGAVSKTTLARIYAQVWAASNAGDDSSVVLNFLRLLAHMAVGNPDGLVAPDDAPEDEIGELDGDSLGLFEWSASPGSSVWDRGGWAMANPSLGHGLLTERAIASAARTDPEAVFRTEVLCQHVSGRLESVFGQGNWEARALGSDKKPPKSPDAIGVGVSVDRAWASIGCAGFRKNGRLCVAAGERRRGVGWVVKRATEIHKKHGCNVVVAAHGPASTLIADLVEAIGDEHVVIASTNDLCDASSQMFDKVQEGELDHFSDPELDEAVAGASWRQVGDGRRAFGRKVSTSDISMLEGVALATWDACQEKESVYEQRGLVRL
jgi:hypothetical protein